MGRQSTADELKRKHNLETEYQYKTSPRRRKSFQGVISRAGDLLKSIGFTDEFIINTVKARKEVTYNDLYDLFLSLPDRPEWSKATFRVYVLKQMTELVDSGAIKLVKDIRSTSIFVPAENKEIVKDITKEKVSNPIRGNVSNQDTPENLARRAKRVGLTDDVLLSFIPDEGIQLPKLLETLYPRYKNKVASMTFRKYLSGIAKTSSKINVEILPNNTLVFYPAKLKAVEATISQAPAIGFNVEEPQPKKLGFWGRLKYVLFGV